MVRQNNHIRTYRSGKIARVNPDVIKIRKKMRKGRWEGVAYMRGDKWVDRWGNIQERPKDYINYLNRKVGNSRESVLAKGTPRAHEYPKANFYGADKSPLKKPLFPKEFKGKPIIYQRVK